MMIHTRIEEQIVLTEPAFAISLSIHASIIINQTYLDSLKPGSKHTFSEPVVHAFVYDPMNGEAIKLKVDFKKYLSNYSDVFNLYSTKSVVESGLHDVAETERKTILSEMSERKAWNLDHDEKILDRKLLNKIALQDENNMTIKEIYEEMKAENQKEDQ